MGGGGRGDRRRKMLWGEVKEWMGGGRGSGGRWKKGLENKGLVDEAGAEEVRL